MKKILLTGFLPFRGQSVNPSQMLVERLTAPENTVLEKAVLPVEYAAAEKLLRELVSEKKPDIILSVGQAGNSPRISVERIALNLDDSRSSDGKTLCPDEGGDAPKDRKIDPDGPDAMFSTLPVWGIVDAISLAGVPAGVSYTAGTFICNHVMYTGCRLCAAAPEMISGFIHVPFLPQQLKEKAAGRYSMEFDDMLKGLQAALDFTAK